MKKPVFPPVRTALLALLVPLVIAGCASLPKQQAFNREAHHDVRHIAVLGTTPSHLGVFVMNNPAGSFGLIGGLIAASDEAAKEKRFAKIATQAGFDPLAYFKERLTAHMSEHGYTLVWADPQVDSGKTPRAAFGLRKAYGARSDVDAQLDVNFGFLGYAAAGVDDAAPYRPTITLGARLVSPDGKQNFYTDFLAYNNIFNLADAVSLEADRKHYSYSGFNDLQRAGPEAIEGLKVAIDSVAAELARQM